IASIENVLRIKPGRSFAAVSGLGGESIRYWKNGNQLNPWWAATAAMDNGANFGALLCIFNEAGVSGNASCKFEDIDGNLWDEFKISSEPGPAVPHDIMDRRQLGELTATHSYNAAAMPGRDMRETISCRNRDAATLLFDFSALSHDTTKSMRQPHVLQFSGLSDLRSKFGTGARIVDARLQLVGIPTSASDHLSPISGSIRVSDSNRSPFAQCDGGQPGSAGPAPLLLQARSDVSPRRRVSASHRSTANVMWTAFGDPGETWVSPDLSMLLTDAWMADGDDVTVILEPVEGSGVAEAYGVGDGVLGRCRAPKLKLTFK
ncbi:hypothetical protein HK405_006045, partial [Cladochytrium tenue]